MLFNYAIECFNDESLINSLGISKKLIMHSGNKSMVLKFLDKHENSFGMIDEDPDSKEEDLSNYEFILVVF